jgi:hypothetical protein
MVEMIFDERLMWLMVGDLGAGVAGGGGSFI